MLGHQKLDSPSRMGRLGVALVVFVLVYQRNGATPSDQLFYQRSSVSNKQPLMLCFLSQVLTTKWNECDLATLKILKKE